MGRRQDDSEEETWRTEHGDLQELHGPGTVNNMNKKARSATIHDFYILVSYSSEMTLDL